MDRVKAALARLGELTGTPRRRSPRPARRDRRARRRAPRRRVTGGRARLLAHGDRGRDRGDAPAPGLVGVRARRVPRRRRHRAHGVADPRAADADRACRTPSAGRSARSCSGGHRARLVALIVRGSPPALALLDGRASSPAPGRSGRGSRVALEAAAEDGLALAGPRSRRRPGTGRVAMIRGARRWCRSRSSRRAGLAVHLRRDLPRAHPAGRPRHAAADPGAGRRPVASLGAVALVWLLSDAAAAVGVRRLVLERRPVLVGLAARLGRPRPPAAPDRPDGARGRRRCWCCLTGPALVAAAIGWGRVRDILAGGPGAASSSSAPS